MKMFRFLKRRPEAEAFYDSRDASACYAESTTKGLVGFHARRFVKKILLRHGHGANLKVLDIGTGPAHIPMLLAKARPDWKIHGLDGSQTMLDRAQQVAMREKLSVEWICSPAESIALESNQFDLVISRFALHEFAEPKLVLREIIRILKPGGYLEIEDLQRPAIYLLPYFILGTFLYYFFNPKMRRQALQSFQAAYTKQEAVNLMHDLPLATKVETVFFILGPMLTITAGKAKVSAKKVGRQATAVQKR